jgi:hypothetical protein
MLKDLLKRVESALWLGEVICDYGLIGETTNGLRERTYLLLCRREDKIQIVLKTTSLAVIAVGVRYVYLDVDSISRLKEVVADIEKRTQ